MTKRILNRLPPLVAPPLLFQFPFRRFFPAIGLWFLALLMCAGTAHAANTITVTNFPAAVSNSYNGVISLQINGLPTGASNVVVQKFIDANTNGAVDTGDILVQQFQLTAGQAGVYTNNATGNTVTVTNVLPGDSIPAGTQIIAPLNFQNGDYAQNLAAHYLYKVSSPSGQFTAATSLLIVTNSMYPYVVTGAVQNAVSGTNIPNALVLLCQEAPDTSLAQQSGMPLVEAGVVANNLGYFTLRAPAGTYVLAAAKSNFVDNISQAGITFSGTTFTNPPAFPQLTPANTNLIGRWVDAASSTNGLPGISGAVVDTNGLELSFYFTDTNGYFLAPVVTNDVWQLLANPLAVAFQNHLAIQTNPFYAVTNKAVKFTNSLARATTIFYGVVSNNSAIPLSGVELSANDNAGHQSYALSDQNGKYVVVASSGTNLWTLSVLSTNNPGLVNVTNVFSPGSLQTTFTNAGQAIEQNFTLASAPYTISGTVDDVDGNPIPGVQVYAASTGPPSFQALPAVTDANGNYTLFVNPGTWTVGLSTNSLDSLGFTNVPATQSVVISAASATGIDFSVLICDEVEVTSTNLPGAIIGTYYETNLSAESCRSITNWTIAYGITLDPLYVANSNSIPAGTAVFSSSQLVAINETFFSFGIYNGAPYASNCTILSITGASPTWHFMSVQATVNVSGPVYGTNKIQFNGKGQTWTLMPTTQSSPPYSTTVTLDTEVSMTLNGQNPQLLALCGGWGLITSSGSSNTVATILGVLPPLTNGFALNVASTTPYLGTNGANAWIQSPQGTNEYLISADGPQTNGLPPGLTLYPNGLLAGTPYTTITTNESLVHGHVVYTNIINGLGACNFTVAAEDSASDVGAQPLTIFVSPPVTTLGNGTNSTGQTAGMLSSNVFPLVVDGVYAGATYTVQMTTNLLSTNWTSIFTTNAVSTNALVIPDRNATNPARFYRILITP